MISNRTWTKFLAAHMAEATPAKRARQQAGQFINAATTVIALAIALWAIFS